MDPEILHAFEMNYVKLAYDAAGYGNSAIHTSDLIPQGRKNAMLQKPY